MLLVARHHQTRLLCIYTQILGNGSEIPRSLATQLELKGINLPATFLPPLSYVLYINTGPCHPEAVADVGASLAPDEDGGEEGLA